MESRHGDAPLQDNFAFIQLIKINFILIKSADCVVTNIRYVLKK